MSEHTATPWHVGLHNRVIGATSQRVALCDDNELTAGSANAAFIVTACNSHAALTQQRDELAAALEFYADSTRYQGPNQRANGSDKFTQEGQPYRMDATRDGGDIARAALAKVKP